MGNRHYQLTPVLALALVLATALWPAGLAAAQQLEIDRDNIVVNATTQIKPGHYYIRDSDGSGVIRITTDNAVVDFRGATLAATEHYQADLDRADGTGVLIDGARNVIIRNANVHGYRYNIRAINAPGLTLENCDVSYSRAQRIARDGRPIAIWIHLRSIQAWRDYGGGIWIEQSDNSTVSKCRGCSNQNGLLLVDSAGCTVTECDFSFNSGFGIGLWGASKNVVAWNMLDFVNRPWGGGWGGDSAALVIVNGSNENYIVGNSMTHGGDGLFLTDCTNGGINGQTKTTNIQGSCDRNIIAYNDGSWSPHNAFEGTFSTGNVYYRNIANDSHYGYWLGFSDDSLLLENEIFRIGAEGIAIEHGSGTRVEGNTFGDVRGAAVALWARGDWVGKLHPSRDSDIRDNVIRDCGRSSRLDNATEVSVGGNTIENTAEPNFDFVERPSTGALVTFKKSDQYKRLQEIVATKPTDFMMLRDGPGPKGIPWIQADHFSPRDYRNQLVAWRKKDACTLEISPLATGRLGFTMPGWINVEWNREANLYVATARPTDGPGESRPYSIDITQTGSSKTQTLTGTFLTAQWDVCWYRWDQPAKLAYDDHDAWARLFKSDPIHRQTTRDASRKLWSSGFPEGVPRSHFAIVASTQIKLAGGRYRLSTLSDDGLRLFLDGKEVISRWNHHGPTPDRTEVEIAAGVHEFVIHYCQESGASALEFAWEKLDD
ncbi:MAG TPA: right-handed parallel beta-helix repeat-containing protein [Phycisphaerae bacterium]|nr:right-handed parallel beta-helix repeat-containing protein [Phycisphaerae bacterium]